MNTHNQTRNIVFSIIYGVRCDTIYNNRLYSRKMLFSSLQIYFITNFTGCSSDLGVGEDFLKGKALVIVHDGFDNFLCASDIFSQLIG
jgi:hypothetical protein